MKTTSRRPFRNAQSGVMLLEALIGILIFSLGILAMVGLQAMSIRFATDARERAEASNLAGQLVGQMWLDRAALANYAYPGSGTVPAALTTFLETAAEMNAKFAGESGRSPKTATAGSAKSRGAN